MIARICEMTRDEFFTTNGAYGHMVVFQTLGCQEKGWDHFCRQNVQDKSWILLVADLSAVIHCDDGFTSVKALAAEMMHYHLMRPYEDAEQLLTRALRSMYAGSRCMNCHGSMQKDYQCFTDFCLKCGNEIIKKYGQDGEMTRTAIDMFIADALSTMN